MPKFHGDGLPGLAKMDIVTPGAGLFRVGSDNPKLQQPTPRSGFKVEVVHSGTTHEFRSGIQLDATDLRVLLALVATAGNDGERFNSTSESPPLPALWGSINAEGHAATRDAVVVTTTAYALLAAMGLTDSGSNRKRLKESLLRLSLVREFMRRGNELLSGSNLLSFKINKMNGELTIGLSPQAARAVLGESKQFVAIDLAEVRQLTRPAAIIIHAALSTRIRRGKSARYHLDKLGEMTLGSTALNPTTRRTRRLSIKPALAEIGALQGWSVAIDGLVVAITRPSN